MSTGFVLTILGAIWGLAVVVLIWLVLTDREWSDIWPEDVDWDYEEEIRASWSENDRQA